MKPTEVLSKILDDPKNLANVKALVSDDFTYVSLNYSHPNLKKIMPWCGTSHGAEAIVQTFTDVGRYWDVLDFKSEALFDDGANVAMFGRFTYRSTAMKREVTSPFAVFAKVRDGRCTYMQFMEDTLATSASFKSGGEWIFRSNPNGEEVRF